MHPISHEYRRASTLDQVLRQNISLLYRLKLKKPTETNEIDVCIIYFPIPFIKVIKAHVESMRHLMKSREP